MTQTKKPFYTLLYIQVLAAIILAVIFGALYPATAAEMKPLGDGFIRLIRMLIAPIIYGTIVVGIARMGDMRKVGRVGGKALIYFEVMTTVALILGIVVVDLVQPGAGMHVDPSKLDAAAIATYAQKAQHQSAANFFLNIIPNTFVSAFAQGEILQVLLLACLSGVVLSHAGGAGKALLDLIDQFTHMLFGVIGLVMKLAPVGAFGAMSFTIGSYGLGTLKNLIYLLGAVYATSIFFVLVCMGLVARYCGFGIWKYLRYIKEEFFIVLGTSSSETVLPRIMDKLERAGCAKPVVGLVVPTGYSFNLDGTSIYLTMAALFVAQACDIPLTLEHKLAILGLLLLTSKGAAAVAGGGFITLAATFASMDTLPLAGLALLLGVDPFMSQCRALTNVIGNGMATFVVAKWENALDTEAMHRAMDGNATLPPDAAKQEQ